MTQSTEPAPANDASAKPSPPRSLWQRLLREWVAPFAVIAAVMGLGRSSLADWNDVPTGSMEPSILPGDRIFVNKLAFGLRVPFTQTWVAHWGGPARGDVVVLTSPKDGARLVKRVVAVPGDTLELRDNHLILNGQPADYAALEDSAIQQISSARRPNHRFASEFSQGVRHPVMLTPAYRSLRNFGPIALPAGKYFMMGDNRDNSADSRFFGFVDRDQIIGRSPYVALSVDPEHYYLPRFGRFFRPIP